MDIQQIRIFSCIFHPQSSLARFDQFHLKNSESFYSYGSRNLLGRAGEFNTRMGDRSLVQTRPGFLIVRIASHVYLDGVFTNNKKYDRLKNREGFLKIFFLPRINGISGNSHSVLEILIYEKRRNTDGVLMVEKTRVSKSV